MCTMSMTTDEWWKVYDVIVTIATSWISIATTSMTIATGILAMIITNNSRKLEWKPLKG